jgi:hypothetical protein
MRTNKQVLSERFGGGKSPDFVLRRADEGEVKP